ncbi:MAG: GGDEF domain-containing protein [Alphaproteobacteria bacterium]|nr:GGDEF domain-containing protein [Alphaproteobacteria bacterium]MDD9919226.1 GGDEF domain-containing protein [Alphaproteobacteria bacterium]
MNETAGIQQDIKTIRDIETALEEAEGFIGRVKSNKVRLTLQNGNISINREEMAKITDLVITLERSGKALESAVKYLRELMAYDEVTNMFSRRYIFHLLEKELYRAQRYENSFSLLALELDVFSGNEHLPHLSTNDMNLLVSEAARAVRKHIRDCDSPGRTGERTFLVLLPETDTKGAFILAERIRKSIDKELEVSIGPVHTTANGGIIESSDPAVTDMAGLLYVIDQKLSAAREKGPNCIVKS